MIKIAGSVTAIAALVALLYQYDVADAFVPPKLSLRQPTTIKTTTTTVGTTTLQASVEKDAVAVENTNTSEGGRRPFFSNIMAANRAEIAVRIMRAATEMNSGTVGIYVHEDRYSQHRWGADRSFLLEKAEGATPISAYLDIDQIIQIAKDADVDAIHPGYGFLSESPEFAKACGEAGIVFVGPTVENLLRFSDKTAARKAAIEAGVPVVPGSDGALKTTDDVVAFVESIGLPVIIKAAMGGGGKGMRVVRNMDDLVPFFKSASSEALASFGDGSVFVERFVDRPRHIEVQIIGDGTGNIVHLWERDCSVQRRHQKVIEMAPAFTLPDDLRKQLHQYAIQLTSAAKYKNAGTVEFLVDSELRPYFIEVNPRIQVEHTVTEEVTGVDLVQAQMKIAAGASLEEVGLIQENISARYDSRTATSRRHMDEISFLLTLSLIFVAVIEAWLFNAELQQRIHSVISLPIPEHCLFTVTRQDAEFEWMVWVTRASRSRPTSIR